MRALRFALVFITLGAACTEDETSLLEREVRQEPQQVVIVVTNGNGGPDLSLSTGHLEVLLAWSGLPLESTYLVHIIDPSGDTQYRLEGEVDEYGVTRFEFPIKGGLIDEGRQTGWWTVEARANSSVLPLGMLSFEIHDE